MRKFINVLLCFGVLIPWQLCQVGVVNAKDKYDEKHKGKAFECSIAGTWRIGTGDGFMTVIPTDPTGRKFSIFVDGPKPEDPSLYGVFQNATASTQTRGIAVKVAQNLYKYTLTQIAVEVVDGEVIPLGEFEVTGETKFVNCDKRVSSYSFRWLYPDGEEVFPEYCGFATGVNYRYEIVPPCGELLPFPE